MKVYLVGGAVRNELMKIPAKDFDYVWVGATEADMLAKGFKKVGADFPVYLDNDGVEHALARREKSTGSGYNDFAVEFGPDVTIEEDLGRRDFTMNAIAKDIETGEYIDPFGGIEDIKNRVLDIMYDDVFNDDPVRILRAARFIAQIPALELSYRARQAMLKGDISKATSERVALELNKALMGNRPSMFFTTLFDVGQLKDWFPEIFDLINVPQPIQWHAEGDAYTHVMMVLDGAAKHNEPLMVRWGALVHDLGKGNTPQDVLPSHKAHEMRGVPLVKALVARLKLPVEFRRVGAAVSLYHTHVHNTDKMGAKAFVNVWDDVKNHPEDIDVIAKVGFYDNYGKMPYSDYDNKHIRFWHYVKAANVKLSSAFSVEKIEAMSIEARQNNHHKLKIANVKLVMDVLKGIGND